MEELQVNWPCKAHRNSQTWPPPWVCILRSWQMIPCVARLVKWFVWGFFTPISFSECIKRPLALGWGCFFCLKWQEEIDISSPFLGEVEEGREVRCAGKWLFLRTHFRLCLFPDGRETPPPTILWESLLAMPILIHILQRNARIVHNIWFYKAKLSPLS